MAVEDKTAHYRLMVIAALLSPALVGAVLWTAMITSAQVVDYLFFASIFLSVALWSPISGIAAEWTRGVRETTLKKWRWRRRLGAFHPAFMRYCARLSRWPEPPIIALYIGALALPSSAWLFLALNAIVLGPLGVEL